MYKFFCCWYCCCYWHAALFVFNELPTVKLNETFFFLLSPLFQWAMNFTSQHRYLFESIIKCAPYTQALKHWGTVCLCHWQKCIHCNFGIGSGFGYCFGSSNVIHHIWHRAKAFVFFSFETTVIEVRCIACVQKNY